MGFALFLGEEKLGHIAGDKAGRTDSYTFRDVVPECLNVAVGYNRPHEEDDEQDIDYLDALGDRLTQVPWESFPVRRFRR